MIKQLITNKDIKAIEAKLTKQGSLSPDESALLREQSLSESNIQISCNNIIKSKDGNHRYNSYDTHKEVEFVQIDNGGKTGICTKMIKTAEGTKKGFFDVVIWLRRADILGVIKTKQIFIEFKKIGSHKISPEQQGYHDHHKKWGESTYFCNNSVFFERVICQEIDEFLNTI